MSSSKILPLRLREPKALAVLLAYIALSSALEAAVVYYAFLLPGLEDIALIGPIGFWTGLIPALVVSVLVLSLLHLTRSFYVAPMRSGRPRPRRARARSRRKQRRWWSRLSHKISRATEPFRNAWDKLVSRLGALGLAVSRGLGIAILGICAAVMMALLIPYSPQLFDFSGRLAKEVGLFSWLVSATTGLAKALASGGLRWLADGLVWASIGLSEGLKPLWVGLAEADPVFKYAAAQNLIAWTTALSALMYRRPLIRGVKGRGGLGARRG